MEMAWGRKQPASLGAAPPASACPLLLLFLLLHLSEGGIIAWYPFNDTAGSTTVRVRD